MPELSSDASDRRVAAVSPIVETVETVDPGLEAEREAAEALGGLEASSGLCTCSTECMGDTLSCGVGPESGDTELRVRLQSKERRYDRLWERWTGRSGGNLKGASKEWWCAEASASALSEAGSKRRGSGPQPSEPIAAYDGAGLRMCGRRRSSGEGAEPSALESVGSSSGVTSSEGTVKSGSSDPVIGGISISLTLRGRYTSIRSGSVPGSSYTAGPRSNDGSVDLVRGSVMNRPLSRDGSAPYPPSRLESSGSCENEPMKRWLLK